MVVSETRAKCPSKPHLNCMEENMKLTHASLSVTFACALGAFIGTMIAMETAARFEYGSYLWVIGAFAGGLMAYVAVDFKRFCAGVSRSYRKTIAWRPDRLWWKTFAIVLCGFLTLILLPLMLFGIVTVTASVANTAEAPIAVAAPMSLVFWTLLLTTIGMTLLTVGVIPRRTKDEAEREKVLHRLAELGWCFMLQWNPLAISLAIYRSLRHIVARTPAAIRHTACVARNGVVKATQFIALTFVYVHSRRRMICFLCAAIGAAIGYHFGNVFIGASAGALLGFLNYQFVSIRLLKAAPSSR